MNRYLFKVTFTDEVHHRVSTCGGMDSEYSHTSREPKEEFFVLNKDDHKLAALIWNHQNKYREDTMEDVVITPIGYLNAEYIV